MRSRFFNLNLARLIDRALRSSTALTSIWGLLLISGGTLLLIWPELLPALVGIIAITAGVFTLTLAWQSWLVRRRMHEDWPAQQRLPRARFVQLRFSNLQRRRWMR